jgi:hypothetical protein
MSTPSFKPFPRTLRNVGVSPNSLTTGELRSERGKNFAGSLTVMRTT